MFATAVIVFREVVEAALIVGIVLAASRGAVHRGWWVGTGILAGLFGSVTVAGFADVLAEAAAGMGQELFNAAILLTAVVMLGWHNVWMRRHGRELARDMSSVGRAVLSGERPLYALAIVVGLAILREGSEVVLFLYGIASGDASGIGSMLAGGAIGLCLGATVGAALYFGLLKVPPRYLFSVTSLLILFLAAGLAAQAAAYLVQADWIPPLGREIWNTSGLLSEDSLAGQLLHALVGYVSRPDGVQVLFYLGTLVIIACLMRWVGDKDQPRAST